ncbi:MAG: hypothetical protein AAB491_01745 [Patescibacteria group bacterium]
MKFFIQVTKTANKFHFISNLTDWHFSCRESDNKRWLEETGKLTQKEKNALKLFTKILKKYDFGENFIGKPFTRNNDKEIWKNIKKFINKKEFERIQEIFYVFDKRFEKIWKKERDRLKFWKIKLQKYLSKYKGNKEIFGKSKIFFRAKNLPSTMEIYLLIGSGGGGANIGKGAITLDFSNRPISHLKYALGVITHETLHLIANSSQYYLKNLKKTAESLSVPRKNSLISGKRRKRSIVNEAIIGAICPEGYVFTKYFLNLSDKKANKYFEKRIHNAKNKFSEWRTFSAKKLYFITKDYFENKKPIDKEFFNTTIQIFKKFN